MTSMVKWSALTGRFYQLRSDGSARPVTGDQKTPFAVVTFFRPEQELDVVQQMTKSDVLALIEKVTDANLFNAVRVDGIFDEVQTRTVRRQVRPFPPLTEAAKHQAEKVFTNVEGSSCKLLILSWRPRRDLNPCYRRERALICCITL
jgi:acetolactate decarboxylase